MKPVQYQTPQYQPVAGKLQPKTIRDFQGLNTYDPYMIPENQFTDMSNLTSADYPALSVRPGYTQLGAAFGTNVVGLGVWKDQQLHAVFDDGVWRRWDGSSWITVMSGLSPAEASFTNFQGNLPDVCLFMTNGINGLKKWDGATAVAFGDAPADLNYITTYQNRLWGASSGKEVRACALDQPDKWNIFAGTGEDSYVKNTESIRGENIDGLSGSLTKLTVSMSNSLYELYGALPSDFSLRSLTDDSGFQNNKAATTVDGIMYYMHKTGIYEYSGGVIPSRDFSDVISAYYPTVYFDSAAGSDGTRAYFRVAQSTDATVLVYDNRPNVNAWVKWDGLRATHFVMMQNQLYVGSGGGTVTLLGARTDDNGTPINWFATTKPFTNPSMSQRSRWIKLWVSVELAAGSSMQVLLSPSADQNDFTLAQTVIGTGLHMQRVVVPLTNFQYNEIVRVKLQGTGFARIHEITMQTRQLPLY